MNPATALPELDAAELAHCARLTERIRREIEARHGWIGFADFMRLALYVPGLGYYSAGSHKLGPGGDFVTAPEVAPLFGRCMAVQCAEVLGRLGGGEVLELGAGSGALAVQVLGELARLGALPARYLILDVSADLRERQHTTVREQRPDLLGRVAWIDRLPERYEGVVIANEVLDAQPVERFVKRGGDVFALGVCWQLGGLEWQERAAGPALVEAVRRVEHDIGRALPDGYVSEINLGLGPWLAALARPLVRGVLLFVDYGLPRREYYADERRRGTLLCHFRQRFHDDALARPGLQDVGAWVDFTAVAEAAAAAGLDVAGYTTQAHFLIGNDLVRLLEEDVADDPLGRLDRSRQAMLLTLPGEMGERFRVIALARGWDAPLRGFGVRDLRHTL